MSVYETLDITTRLGERFVSLKGLARCLKVGEGEFFGLWSLHDLKLKQTHL